MRTENNGGADNQKPIMEVSRPGLLRALEWIGLDLTGPTRSSNFQIGIYALLVFIPLAVAVRLLNVGGPWLFVTAAAAIIPLAKILSTATEHLVHRVGPGIGGLLNATFANAVEMIIAFFALQAGLYEVVKASITGSIVGNVLFVLGLSMFLGGLGRDKQTFNRIAAGVSATQLIVAATALLVPAVFVLTTSASQLTTDLEEELSLGVSAILLIAYVAQSVFFLRTHRHLYADVEGDPDDAEAAAAEEAAHEEAWSLRHSLGLLLGVTVLVGVMAEILVEGLEYMTETLGFTQLFVGVILVAIVGSAAENVTAVTAAMKNRMDLCINIAMSSTLQIALFVAPVLVLIGFLTGHQLDLVFNIFEVAAVVVTMLITNSITADGESNWFEGVQLLAAYGILAVAFFFHP